jgi:Fe2+ or Zn2+ uptake regulation protein
MSHEKNLAQLRRYFNTSCKRYTVEREHMLDVIDEMEDSFTIVELYKVAKTKGFVHAASTLYRNLFIFIDSGFITERHLSGGKVEYEKNTGKNSFLLCVGCGTLTKIPVSKEFKAMQKELCEKHKMMPVAYNFQQKGYCSKCQKKLVK